MLGDEQSRSGFIASLIGKHQVLVERGLQYPRVRDAKNSVARLDVVCDTETRLRLLVSGEPVIKVATYSHIEGPVSFGDGILRVQGEFFHVGVSHKVVQCATAREIVWSQGCARRRDGVPTRVDARITIRVRK